MKEHDPKWDLRFKTDPYIRKTFTNEHMRRVEERVAMYNSEQSGKRNKGFRSVVGMAAVFIVILFGIGVYVGDFFSSERSNWSANLPEQKLPVIQTQEPQHSQENIKTYQLKGEVQVFDNPVAFGSNPIAILSEKDQSYEIIERKGAFVKIMPPLPATAYWGSGWIPEWYIITEGSTSLIEVVEPYPLLVGDPVTFSLYPEEPTPSGVELSAGRVVQVNGRFGDWLRVDIAIYDSPYTGDKWILESALAEWNPSKAKEGMLIMGATVYEENGKASIEWPIILSPVRIVDEVKDRYLISAGGEYTGWINKEDFSPGIEIYTVVDQSDDEEGDPDWFMSDDEVQAYEQYAKIMSDDLLKGLEPLVIFRYYVTASLARDFESMHALYIKGDEYATPDLETFLSEVQSDPVLEDNAKKLWEKLQHYQLDQVINGTSAVIKITNGSDDPQDQQQFSLTQNHEGVWKVNWLAMQ